LKIKSLQSEKIMIASLESEKSGPYEVLYIFLKKNLAIVYSKGLQTFLSKGHVSYYTTVWGSDILRSVIVSG